MHPYCRDFTYTVFLRIVIFIVMSLSPTKQCPPLLKLHEAVEAGRKCFEYKEAQTIPSAKDAEKLWDMAGTVSLLSMGQVRKLYRERKLDAPRLPERMLVNKAILGRERKFKVSALGMWRCSLLDLISTYRIHVLKCYNTPHIFVQLK